MCIFNQFNHFLSRSAFFVSVVYSLLNFGIKLKGKQVGGIYVMVHEAKGIQLTIT